MTEKLRNALAALVAAQSPRAHLVGCRCGGINPGNGLSCRQMWEQAEAALSASEGGAGVSDEAVEAACIAAWPTNWQRWDEASRKESRNRVRHIISAAMPYLLQSPAAPVGGEPVAWRLEYPLSMPTSMMLSVPEFVTDKARADQIARDTLHTFQEPAKVTPLYASPPPAPKVGDGLREVLDCVEDSLLVLANEVRAVGDLRGRSLAAKIEAIARSTTLAAAPAPVVAEAPKHKVYHVTPPENEIGENSRGDENFDPVERTPDHDPRTSPEVGRD